MWSETFEVGPIAHRVDEKSAVAHGHGRGVDETAVALDVNEKWKDGHHRA
jgi:hypothetical protein